MKTCTKCLNSKSLDSFSRKKKSKDGLNWACKPCCRDYDQGYYIENTDKFKSATKTRRILFPDKALAYGRRWRARNRNRAKEMQIKWAKKNPEKIRAQKAVMYAKTVGKITPFPCELCGNKKVEGHHEDYSKPLEVRWLCRRCHAGVHVELRERA